MAKGTPDEIETAAREFLTAVSALCNWLNGNDIAWEHGEQRPEDYERLCAAIERMQAVLGGRE